MKNDPGISSPPLPDSRGVVELQMSSQDVFLFQRWEDGFRCWKSEEGGRPHPTVFPYRIVHESDPNRLHDDLALFFSFTHGLSMTQSKPGCFSFGIDAEKLECGEDGLPVKLLPFQELLQSIPEHVRVLVSQCERDHYLALEAMRHVPGFSEFLEQELQGLGMSYLLTVWGLGRARKQPRIFRLELAERMITLPRDKMLETLTDEPCSHALFRLIEKLPITDLNPDAIWMAVDALARPAMRQAVGEIKLISAEALAELVKLPDWLLMPTLVRLLVDAFHQGHTLESIIPPSLLTAPEAMQNRLRESLSGARTLLSLEKRIHQWADRLYYEVSFPPPPVKGNDLLHPLRTGLMLRQEGRKMQNCVAGYAEDVLDGESYFYAWRGHIRATVQLDHTSEGHWRLGEALGMENEELPQGEWLKIVESLAESFGDDGLFLCRCSIAGSGYYELNKALPTLTDNTPLCLRREPGNPHDSNAIEILTKNGLKLGYVPHSKNEDAARWMAAGLTVRARLLSTRGCLIEVFVCA